MHNALHDARATACLLQKILSIQPDTLSVYESIGNVDFENVPWPEIMREQVRLLPRDIIDKTETNEKPLIHNPVNEAAATQFIEMNGHWPGKTVCFTGESQCSMHGGKITREMAECVAAGKGLIVQSYVTKKLDYLIAADPNTQSSKAKKARQYGTRIIPEQVFWRTLGVSIDEEQK